MQLPADKGDNGDNEISQVMGMYHVLRITFSVHSGGRHQCRRKLTRVPTKYYRGQPRNMSGGPVTIQIMSAFYWFVMYAHKLCLIRFKDRQQACDG